MSYILFWFYYNSIVFNVTYYIIFYLNNFIYWQCTDDAAVYDIFTMYLTKYLGKLTCSPKVAQLAKHFFSALRCICKIYLYITV